MRWFQRITVRRSFQVPVLIFRNFFIPSLLCFYNAHSRNRCNCFRIHVLPDFFEKFIFSARAYISQQSNSVNPSKRSVFLPFGARFRSFFQGLDLELHTQPASVVRSENYNAAIFRSQLLVDEKKQLLRTLHRFIFFVYHLANVRC